MEFFLITPTQINEQFIYLLMFWAFIIGVFSVIFSSYTDKPYKFALTCFIIYLVVALGVYGYTYSGFTSIVIENKEIKLSYAGWNRKIIRIPANQIKFVTYEVHSKQCYVQLEDKNSNVYRSVNVQNLGDVCQKLKLIIKNNLQ